MTVEAHLLGNNARYDFRPAPNNETKPEPGYSKKLKAWVIRHRGKARITVFEPNRNAVSKVVLVADEGDRARVTVGLGVRRERLSNGHLRVRLKTIEDRYVLKDESKTIKAGIGTIKISHKSSSDQTTQS